MIALVLAAGFGTRFRPLTLTTPKTLIPFRGRPILFHLLDHLIGQGVERFVINCHHLGEELRAAVGDRYAGRPVAFSPEDPILGTSGAIRRAADERLLGDGPFLVVNGDLYTTLPLARLRTARKAQGVLSALAVLPNAQPQVDTPLWADAGGRLLAVGGPNPGAEATGPWLFTGVQAASPELLERIPQGASELARDVLAPAVAGRERAFALVPYRTPEDGFWFDLGSPQKLRAAEDAVSRHTITTA